MKTEQGMMVENMTVNASGMEKGQGLKGFVGGGGRNALPSGCSRILQQVSTYHQVTTRQKAFRMEQIVAPVS